MDNNPSGHIRERFTITPTNGSSYVDNQTLKQSILAQEATFRKQKDLMTLECQTYELNGHSQASLYSSPSTDIRTPRPVGPSRGHGMKKPSEKIMKGKDLECNSNRVSMMHYNTSSTEKMLSLQVPGNDSDDVVILLEKPEKSLPRNNCSIHDSNVKDLQVLADAHANDSDDDVVILSEKPANFLPGNTSSILCTNVKGVENPAHAHVDDSDDDVVILSEKPSKSLPQNNGSILGKNLKGLQVLADAHVDGSDDDVVILSKKPTKILPIHNGSMIGANVKIKIESSSHMNKNWITGLQPSDVSKINVLNKKLVGSSITMKTKTIPSVGSSSCQNQFYSSAGVNQNLPNVKLNIDPSSCMQNNWVISLQQSNVSTVNALNKEVVDSNSTMKTTNIPSVGASSCPNQCFSSVGVNLNLPSLGVSLKEKCVDSTFGSNIFFANEETRNNSSYNQTRYDQSNGIEWFTHKKNETDSFIMHDQSSYSIHNPEIFAATSSNAAFKSLWESNTKDYIARQHYADTGMPIGQNGHHPKFQEYSHLHSSNIPGASQYQNHSPLYDCPKDVNLNNGPQDRTAIVGQAREDIPMEISWVKKRLESMRSQISMESQVPLIHANGHSQISPGNMPYSEGSTRILGFPVNVATKKESQLSSTMHMGKNNTPSRKGVANMEMQFQNKDTTNARNLIDLNIALPVIDDMEIDNHFSEGDTIPQEQHDPSNEAHVVTAAKNLMFMHEDMFQEGPSQDVRNQDRVYNSTMLAQEHKSGEDHGDSATNSTFNAFDQANSSEAIPPEGHYARYPGL